MNSPKRDRGRVMRAVVQRVSEASVTMVREGEEQLCGSIARGLLVYCGVGEGDTDEDARYLADKVANLRIFMDSDEKMNLSVLDIDGDVLVISQFTLLADARKGRRPSYSGAADPAEALRLYEAFIEMLRAKGIRVQTGRFQEIMRVRYTNEGPVTILLDSRKVF